MMTRTTTIMIISMVVLVCLQSNRLRLHFWKGSICSLARRRNRMSKCGANLPCFVQSKSLLAAPAIGLCDLARDVCGVAHRQASHYTDCAATE